MKKTILVGLVLLTVSTAANAGFWSYVKDTLKGTTAVVKTVKSHSNQSKKKITKKPDQKVIVKTSYLGPSVLLLGSGMTIGGLLIHHNLKQMEDYPIENEVQVALDEGRTYTTRYCLDPNGAMKTLREDFKHCPWGGEIMTGPQFKSA